MLGAVLTLTVFIYCWYSSWISSRTGLKFLHPIFIPLLIGALVCVILFLALPELPHGEWSVSSFLIPLGSRKAYSVLLPFLIFDLGFNRTSKPIPTDPSGFLLGTVATLIVFAVLTYLPVHIMRALSLSAMHSHRDTTHGGTHSNEFELGGSIGFHPIQLAVLSSGLVPVESSLAVSALSGVFSPKGRLCSSIQAEGLFSTALSLALFSATSDALAIYQDMSAPPPSDVHNKTRDGATIWPEVETGPEAPKEAGAGAEKEKGKSESEKKDTKKEEEAAKKSGDESSGKDEKKGESEKTEKEKGTESDSKEKGEKSDGKAVTNSSSSDSTFPSSIASSLNLTSVASALSSYLRDSAPPPETVLPSSTDSHEDSPPLTQPLVPPPPSSTRPLLYMSEREEGMGEDGDSSGAEKGPFPETETISTFAVPSSPSSLVTVLAPSTPTPVLSLAETPLSGEKGKEAEKEKGGAAETEKGKAKEDAEKGGKAAESEKEKEKEKEDESKKEKEGKSESADKKAESEEKQKADEKKGGEEKGPQSEGKDHTEGKENEKGKSTETNEKNQTSAEQRYQYREAAEEGGWLISLAFFKLVFYLGTGVSFGLVTGLSLSHLLTRVASDERLRQRFLSSPSRDAAVMLLWATFSFFLASTAGLDPLLCLLVCAVCMGSYAKHSLPGTSQRVVSEAARMARETAEGVLLAFLGAAATESLVLSFFSVSKPEDADTAPAKILAVLTALTLLFARALAVPICLLLSLLTKCLCCRVTGGAEGGGCLGGFRLPFFNRAQPSRNPTRHWTAGGADIISLIAEGDEGEDGNATPQTPRETRSGPPSVFDDVMPMKELIVQTLCGLLKGPICFSMMLFATRRPSNPETVDVIGPLRHAPPLLCFFSCLLVILVAPLLGASGDSGNAWTVLGKKAESEGVHGTVGSSLDSVGTSDEELGAEGDDGDEGRAYAQRIRGITGKERRKRMDMNGRRVEGRRGDREWGGYGEEPYTRGGRLTPLREEDEDYYGDEISLRSPTERRERDRNDHSSARTVIFKGDGGSDGEEDGEGRSSRRGRKGGEKGRTFLDRLWTDFDETYLRPLFGGPDVVASNLREARILKAQQRRLRTAKQQEGGQESSYRSHGGDHSDAPYESRVNYFPSTPAGSYGRINSRRYFTHHAERSGGAGRSAPDVHRYRESPATRDAVQKAPAYFLRKERGRVDVGVGGGARDYDAIGREEETEESGYSRAYYQRAQGAPPSRPHARRGEPSDASYDQRGPPAVRFAQMRGRGGESGYDHGGGGGYGSSRSDYDRGVSGGQLDRSAGSSVRGREGQGSRYGAGNPFPPTPAQYIERGWQGPRAEDSYMWSGEEPGARGGSWRGGVSGRSDASGGYRDYPRGGGGSDLGPRGDRGPERYDRRQPHEYQSGGRNADSAARRAAQYDAREYDQEGVQARYIR